MLSILIVVHHINKFLGTPAGELLKRSSEFILLAFASYMVASEWMRTKSAHLKYLLIGFGSLALQKLITTMFLAQLVFLGISLGIYADVISLIENFLEIGALVLISSAFLYAVHEKHGISLRRKTYVELGGLALLFVLLTMVAFDFFPFLPFGIKRKVVYSAMELAKFVILLFPVYIFWKNRELTVYNRGVAAAFVVYSITPLIKFVNWVMYYGTNIDLTVLAHPFPFISIVLFSRVLFLKLVDKATLKEELFVTKQKYIREREIGAMKDEFVSTVSHELRTPLTSLRLYMGLLLQGKFGELTEKQHETLMMMDKEGGRLGKLINEVLDLARYEKKKEKLVFSHVSLHRLVQSSIYPHLTEEHNVSIVNSVPLQLMVSADADKFKQVIINLLTNALKYTPPRGAIIFSACEKDGAVVFTVSDTGCGIASDVLPYIFDKFYQVEHHMVRTTGGVGLGLAIVKNIVELHGGMIDVSSEVGKGTTFTVTLPQKLNKQNHRVARKTA